MKTDQLGGYYYETGPHLDSGKVVDVVRRRHIWGFILKVE